MPKTVFVSYSHIEAGWVRERLVPVLRAAGCTILIDDEQSQAGRTVTTQMDAWQDKADVSLLVLSPNYLKSAYCQHEMNRAVNADTTFAQGRVLPILRAPCDLPHWFKDGGAVYVNLCDDEDPDKWGKLLEPLEAMNLGATAPHWLDVRDDIVRRFKVADMESGPLVSVNLRPHGNANWRELCNHLKRDCLPDLAIVDLDDPTTCTRDGLVRTILTACGGGSDVMRPPRDLEALAYLKNRPTPTRLALIHFENVKARTKIYGADLFFTIRHYLENRKLILLIESRQSFFELIPSDHPMSKIQLAFFAGLISDLAAGIDVPIFLVLGCTAIALDLCFNFGIETAIFVTFGFCFPHAVRIDRYKRSAVLPATWLTLAVLASTAAVLYIAMHRRPGFSSAGIIWGGLFFVIIFWSILYRIYYLPLHWVLLRYSSPALCRRYHPVFWDNVCATPFANLESTLIRNADFSAEDGNGQIERIITSRLPYRDVAIRARTILVARSSAAVKSLARLDTVLTALPSGATGYLAESNDIRQKAAEIARQQQYVDAADRPFYKEQAIIALRAEINAFGAKAAGCHEPLATEFREAAAAWMMLADQQLVVVREHKSREPTPQVFQAGIPVRRDNEAFVPRLDVVATLENEVMAGNGCPGILLYGRRRVGKSSMINNLDGFLPDTVAQVVISMQDPRAFTSVESLSALIANEATCACSAAGEIVKRPTNLMELFEFLRECDAKLLTDRRRLLLCVDEFEAIDYFIGEGRFSKELPAVLRESIQTHRNIIWLFAGSHHFSELRHVNWSSYFVSLRTVEIGLLTPEQTGHLLTQPLRHSRIEGATAEASKRFTRDFWGDEAVQYIHHETGGWPHLVQLLASTVVDLCNKGGRDRVDRKLLEEATQKALVSGETVMSELLLYRSEEHPSAWAYLAGFRERDLQNPPSDDGLRLLLKRHLLVEVSDDGLWGLRIPLLLKWLRERT